MQVTFARLEWPHRVRRSLRSVWPQRIILSVGVLLSAALIGGCGSLGSTPKPTPPPQASQDTAQMVATSATLDNLLWRSIAAGSLPGAAASPQRIDPVPGIQVTHTASLRFYDASGQEQPGFDAQATDRIEGSVQTQIQYALPHWQGQAELNRNLSLAKLLSAPLINGDHRFDGTMHMENGDATVQRDYTARYSGAYRSIAFASRQALFPSSGQLEYNIQLSGSVRGTDHDGQFSLTAHALLTFNGGETAQLVLIINGGAEQHYTVNLLTGVAVAA